MTDLADRLVRAVREDAAVRRVRRLQPTGGPGEKIFPPTYPGDGRNAPPRHVFETRRVGGDNVLCVLVDSVQSQANRLEEALLRARRHDAIAFPAITVDFAGTAVADIGEITTLDAPHRVFDAIVRDAELGNKAFRDTAEGKSLTQAKPSAASAVYELSPTALVFGAWNSTGEGGGLGAKFPRAIVSEIVGVGVATEMDTKTGEQRASGQRPGSRVDPLGIRSGVQVYKLPGGDWTLDRAEAEKAEADAKAKEAGKKAGRAKEDGKPKEPKALKPSEINHSNIAPSLQQLGVSVDYLQHTLVVSMAALRRLHFPVKGKPSGEIDAYAQAALATLAIAAALAQDRAGYFLRSRCDLVPDAAAPGGFEIVRADGTTEPLALSFEDASKLVGALAAKTKALGLAWRAEDVRLTPMRKLVELVQRSREKALQGEAEGDDAG
jgi:CRISPR-associated protein Csb1